MKFQLKNVLAVMALALTFTSCSNDNDDTISGEGTIGLEFDNVFGSSNLILNTQTNTTTQGENLKITEVKYIVSNIVLTKEDGTTFTYPKSKSYFIVDESNEASQMIELEKIPASLKVSIKS
jgi:hypothetical protein